MIKQKKWTILRLIGLALMCVGFVALGMATQGTSILVEVIGLAGLLVGFCIFAYGLVKPWLNK